jgi:dUTPase
MLISTWNRGTAEFAIEPGDRIAQLLLLPIVRRTCKWWILSNIASAAAVVLAIPACAEGIGND